MIKRLTNPMTLPATLIPLSIITAYMTEAIGSRSFLLSVSPYYFMLCILWVTGLTAFFMAITNRVTAAFLLTSLPLLLLACVSSFKYAARGEPLYFKDLSLAAYITGVVDQSVIAITPPMIAAAITILLLLVWLYVFKYPRLTLRQRLLYFAVSITALGIALALCFFTTSKENKVTAKGFTINFIESAAPTVNQPLRALYANNEALTPMEAAANSKVPSATLATDYIQEALEKIKKELLAKQSGINEQPDVIIWLSESFWDITEIEALTFSEDPIPYFRAFREEGIWGHMMSYTFGGGTANVEYELLTGGLLRFLAFPNSAYETAVQSETFSLATVFAQAGYETIGIHTYHRAFYKRDSVYPLLGFQQWKGVEDLEQPLYDGRYVSDQTLTTEVINALEKGEQPKFIMAISMENHQPYTIDKYPDTEMEIQILNSDMDKSLQSNVNVFLHGLRHADEQLRRLTEYLQTTERPTVLLFFGDHQPTLGADFGLYRYSGLIQDPNRRTAEDYRHLLSMPFLLWSNYKDETEHIEAIGQNFLGSYLLSYIGIPKPLFYHYIDKIYQSEFHFASREELYMDVDNQVHDTMTDDLQATLDLYYVLQTHFMDMGAKDILGEELRKNY